MEREDYLIRMIAQMGLVLARVRRMLLEGKNAEAGGELEEAAVKGGIDLGLVIALDESSVRPLLLTGLGPNGFQSCQSPCSFERLPDHFP